MTSDSSGDAPQKRDRLIAARALCVRLESLLDRVPITPSMSPRHMIANHLDALMYELQNGIQDIDEGLA